ncbi:uncharacterized protein LOC142742560 isoform X2 [Rhinoderma darwinii]|uniref:uncharacterized protein LOC142742560 isoform X2 n=1 Tax=Rhinoderma darwinii TaxID=43563 RepID=UPI003F66E195
MASAFPELHDDPRCGAMVAGDNDFLEINGWCSRLRQENTDLQDALLKADVEVYELSQEMSSLRERNKSLQKETSQLQDLKDQVEILRFKVKQNKDAADMEEQQRKNMATPGERRSLHLDERVDQLLNQLDHSQEETLLLKKEVTRLRHLITDLEKNLQKKTLEIEQYEELAQKRESIRKFMTNALNEYASTIEVLNNNIKTLQSQVEESSQEIALRKTVNDVSKMPGHPPEDGTLMCEILQAKIDEEWLLRTKQQKKWGFLGLRFLYTMMLKILWCNTKVAFFSFFFFLLFHYLLPLIQTQEPGVMGCYICSVCSSETFELIVYILQPYLQLIGSGVVPT